MSIVSVDQIGPGRTATAKLNGRREVRTHTQPYRVVTDNPNDTSYEIQAAFPPIGSPHIDDPYAFLVSKDPVADSKGKMLWIVPLVYSTERPRSENPCNDPTDIEWDTDTAMEPYLFDSDGQAMLNSAGDHYGEALKGENAYWTVVCTSNQPFIPSWIDDYKNAINNDNCSIDGRYFQPGQCKVKKIHIGRWQTREEYRYRVLSLTIKITTNPTINLAEGPQQVSGWAKNVIDEGLHCWWPNPLDSGNIKLPCADSAGQPVRKAAALDGYGYQLGSSSGTELPTTPPTADEIIYNSFDIYAWKPFSVLPLN